MSQSYSKRIEVVRQSGETGAQQQPKDIKPMSKILITLLKMIVQIIGSQGARLAALEQEENRESTDDADLLAEVGNLVAQLESPASSAPSSDLM